jgi:hypothetical protein
MKVISADDWDDFDTEIIFWVSVSDPPESIQAEARRIDGDLYSPGCFGVCVCYYTDSKEFELAPDDRGTNIYYVDNDGNKAWFMADIPEGFLDEVFRCCQKALAEPEEKYRRHII